MRVIVKSSNPDRVGAQGKGGSLLKEKQSCGFPAGTTLDSADWSRGFFLASSLSSVSSGVPSGILSCMSSGILSGIFYIFASFDTADTLSGIPSGALSRIFSHFRSASISTIGPGEIDERRKEDEMKVILKSTITLTVMTPNIVSVVL